MKSPIRRWGEEDRNNYKFRSYIWDRLPGRLRTHQAATSSEVGGNEFGLSHQEVGGHLITDVHITFKRPTSAQRGARQKRCYACTTSCVAFQHCVTIARRGFWNVKMTSAYLTRRRRELVLAHSEFHHVHWPCSMQRHE